MPGLFDNLFQDPQQAGLLDIASSLLQAAGPSTQRTSLAQALGGGLQAGSQAYQSALQSQAMNQYRQALAQEAAAKAAQQQQFASFFGQGAPGANSGHGISQGNGVTTFPVGNGAPGAGGQDDKIQAALNSGNPLLMQWAQNMLQFRLRQGDLAARNRSLDQTDWSAPIQTSAGFVQVNRRTGEQRPVVGANGQPLLPTTVDPNVQGNVAQARSFGSKTGEIQAGLPQAAKTAAGTVASANQAYDRLIDSVNELLKAPGLDRTLGVEGMFPNLPGGDAANAEALKKTLSSQVAFTVLQALRDASKTGGAVGQVSDKEQEMMSNNLAALDKAQSPEQYREQLGKILDFAQKSKQRMADAYQNQYGQSLPGFAARQDSSINSVSDQQGYDALPSGATFQGPDGRYYRKP